MSFSRFKRSAKSKTSNVKEDNEKKNEDEISEEEEEFVCDNCINRALISSKPSSSLSPLSESPLDLQERLIFLRQSEIRQKVKQREKVSSEAGRGLGGVKEKEILQRIYEKGEFFKDSDDVHRRRVLENYNRIQRCNEGMRREKDKKEEYYKRYVDGYPVEETEETDEDERRKNMQKYNKELGEQIELKKKLRSYEREEKKRMGYSDNRFERDLEEEEKKRKERNEEINRFNRDLIEEHKKRIKNEKLAEEINERKNNEEIMNKYNFEYLRDKAKDENIKKEWQKSLQEQIDYKNKRIKDLRDLDRALYGHNADDDVCECDPNGRCCCCKRIYPLAVLNPRKKYAAILRGKRGCCGEKEKEKEKEKVEE